MYESVDQGSIRAFNRYIKMLEEMGVKPKDQTKVKNGDPTDLSHLLWMCYECLPNIRDDARGFPPEKYSRRLGYIQGVLVCKGITTVEEERNQTRQYWS